MPTPKTFAATHPNAGIEQDYRRRLEALIADMHGSILYWVRAAYRRDQPAILAMDATPASILGRVMRKLADRWLSKFDTMSKKLAARFAGSASAHADKSMAASMSRAGWAVKFRPTSAVKDCLGAVTRENINLIKSIASEHLDDVEQLVMRSIARGRDLGELTTQLQRRYALTHKRAAFIARDQNNKATAIITNVRQRELGITQAIWLHSHGGRKPRPSHVKASADRLVYEVTKGAYIDGEWIYPGELPNCRCVSRPVIPGLGGK